MPAARGRWSQAHHGGIRAWRNRARRCRPAGAGHAAAARACGQLSRRARSWRRRKASLTVCTLGPMTNLAMAMVMEPRIVPRIREVVLMGGGFFEGGNATPAAEFNIFVDPHAAHKVFESGVPVTMAPIDCTYTAQMTPEWLDACARPAAARRSRPPTWPISIASTAPTNSRPRRGRSTTPASPATCWPGDLRAAALQRDDRDRVAGDDRHDHRRLVAVTGKRKNCNVLRRIDPQPFFDLMLERIAPCPDG